MACARGCCETQAEHYRSLSVASSDREGMKKTRVDDHGTHTVEVTEHWNDRQDVKVNAPPINYAFGPKKAEQASQPGNATVTPHTVSAAASTD